MPLSLSYKLTGLGWAECTLSDDESSTTITSSYLSDALGRLVLAAVAASSGFSRLAFSFEEEPGEYRWVINSPRTNEIELKIFQFDYAYSDLPDEKGQLVFCTRCRPVIFAAAVRRAAVELLTTVGEAGYAKQWEQHPFPSRWLEDLNRILAPNDDA